MSFGAFFQNVIHTTICLNNKILKNETLVEEGFAKYVEDDENLNQLLSATSKKSEKKYNLGKIKILDEEILSDSFKDQFKVRSLVHRSSKFHEQLNEN